VLKEAEEIEDHLLAQDKAISDILDRIDEMVVKAEQKGS
jgi:hypothetical protein